MVMAAQFESLFQPFIIMFSLPPTFIGAVIGLGLTGTHLSVMSLIGAIMLVGIVLNNAIVLVDYINTLRKRGIERKRCRPAGRAYSFAAYSDDDLLYRFGPFAHGPSGGGSGSEMMKPMGHCDRLWFNFFDTYHPWCWCRWHIPYLMT